MTDLDWSVCDAIAAQYGPFYLADVDYFEDNCRRFLAAFSEIYMNARIGYSYKTNYLPHFILRAMSVGAYSEVVSRFEFDLAEKLGAVGHQIIYNGPIKRDEDLVYASRNGAQINIDSIAEYQQLLRLGEKEGMRFNIGVRCYFDRATPRSRFGIDPYSKDGLALFSSITDRNSPVRLSGLHCHHSGDRSPERYRTRIRAMIDFHKEHLVNAPLQYIDIGGGFASRMSTALAAELGGPRTSFVDYAEAVAGEMRRAYGHHGPELILEPGMAILADSMVFLARVEATKEIGGRKVAVVDGSVFNIKPLRGSINLPMSVIRKSKHDQETNGLWDIVGNTCMEIDVLHSEYMGPISVGDFVAIENVGAYSVVLNAPFINSTPAILELRDRQIGRTLRRKLTLGDLLSTYENCA